MSVFFSLNIYIYIVVSGFAFCYVSDNMCVFLSVFTLKIY